MCVIENKTWSYPVGEGQVLRGDDMPNPYALVERVPWDDWEAPWDRGLDGSEGHDWTCEAERVASWLFDVGMTLWEIQEGWSAPFFVVRIPPHPRWLGWALCWLDEAERVAPPPGRKSWQREAWRRRSEAVRTLQVALLGMKHGVDSVKRTRRSREAVCAR